MRQVIIIGTLLVLGAIAATGCMAPEDSCDLKTQGIKVQLAAMEEGDGARGEAELYTDEGLAIILGDCGDKITVNGAELQVVNATASPVVYAADIAQADVYTFVFTRPDEGDYTSTVTDLRDPVVVTAPAEGAEVPRDEDLTVEWENSDGGDIDLVVMGDCISTKYDATWTDNGSNVVPADSLNVSGDTTTCTAELVMTRKVTGTLDPALDSQGGWIEGWSVGRTTFTTISTVE
jgi:hypothetical protein